MRERTYRRFDPKQGYPAGEGLFYECTLCGDVIPSLPPDNTRCRCRNVAIDVDYGRMSVDDIGACRLFSVDER